MDWKLKEGVILTSVCDQFFLVSCSAAQDSCPGIMGINESAAFIWRQMEKGLDDGEIINALSEEYEVTDDTDVSELISSFVSVLKENGYITAGNKEYV